MDDENFDYLYSECDLLENHVEVSFGPQSIYAPANASNRLLRYLQASLIAHQFGIGLNYALKRYVPENTEPSIPEIYQAFQNMYFIGKEHLDSTLGRM